MKPRRKTFRIGDLVLVAGAELYQDAREAALKIGDVISLNSGGPRMMVVDIHNQIITSAWRDSRGEARELSLTRACFHRISPL
jgi:uncharacterized protein YodC (DUF2158 family)